MCIIVSKPKGIAMPDKATLRTCFDNNPDGAGMMFVSKGKVNIIKGLMNFKDFYDHLMKLDKIHNFKNKSLVMHFRISTGGNVDAGNCHPYPISCNEKDLRKTYISTDLGMAHNGIISMYSRKHQVLNDTQMFIKDCVSVIKDAKNDFYTDYRCMSLLEDIAGSKLCFLDSNENIYYVGKFVEDNGIMYSNTTYMPWTYYPRSYGYDYTYYYPTKTYYDEVVDAKKKTNTERKLTSDEFYLCMDNIVMLEKGDKVKVKNDDGSIAILTVGEDYSYGLDNFFNLYHIDWAQEDITTLYSDVELVVGDYDMTLSNDEVDAVVNALVDALEVDDAK